MDELVYGDIDKYISSLFTACSKSYLRIKKLYVNLGHKELFELYETASTELKQSIVRKVIEKAQKNNWSYSDTHHITDSFLMIAGNSLKRNRYLDNLPPNIKELLSAIEQQKLTDDELDSLQTTIRSYFEN